MEMKFARGDAMSWEWDAQGQRKWDFNWRDVVCIVR